MPSTLELFAECHPCGAEGVRPYPPAARLCQKAGHRAEDLEPQRVVLSLDKMLRRLIGENVELVDAGPGNCTPSKWIPASFEQILVNLVVMPAMAMPDGGSFTIETHNVTLDEQYAHRHEDVIPGDYVDAHGE